MFTIIVPIDFSPVSDNAVLYALGFNDQYDNVHYEFYHTYFYHEIAEANTDFTAEAVKHLDNLLAMHGGDKKVSFTLTVNDGFLVENVKAIANDKNAALVVMGITGKNKVAQKVIGSNTLALAKQIATPVLIVPAHAINNGVKNLGIAIPFNKDTITLVPYIQIRNVVSLLGAQLHIISVEPISNIPNRIVLAGENAVHHMFDDLNPKYQIYKNNDVVDSIQRCIEEENINIITTIAEEHGFWESIFRKSITDTLAYNNKIPLLVFNKEK